MNRNWHVTVSVAALLFQTIPVAFLRSVPMFAYGFGILPDAWEHPVSLAALGIMAAVCLALGTVGLYGTLRHAHGRQRVALALGCCAPALLCGTVYLHAALAFLTLV